LFDADFDPIKAGMKKILMTEEITASILIEIFNSICQLSQHYLGHQMTVRYWQSSRPEIDWSNKFQMDSLGQITFVGADTETISEDNVKCYYQWIKSFIKSCSLIIQDFPKIIAERELINHQLEAFFQNLPK
jgi:hypothetical protein